MIRRARANRMAAVLMGSSLFFGVACGTSIQQSGRDSHLPDSTTQKDAAPISDQERETDQGPLPDLVPDAVTPVCPSGAFFDDSIFRKMVFTAMVDGKGPFKLVCDTGAAETILSPKVTTEAAHRPRDHPQKWRDDEHHRHDPAKTE